MSKEFEGKEPTVDSSLTHLCVGMKDIGQWLFECDAVECQEIANGYNVGLPTITVLTRSEHGSRRLHIAREHIVLLEQITKAEAEARKTQAEAAQAEAKEKAEAAQAAQAAAIMQMRAGNRPPIHLAGPIPRV